MWRNMSLKGEMKIYRIRMKFVSNTIEIRTETIIAKHLLRTTKMRTLRCIILGRYNTMWDREFATSAIFKMS